MNPNTGEFIEDTEADPLPDSWVRFTLAETVTIKGIPMRIVKVDRYRLVLEPLVASSEDRLADDSLEIWRTKTNESGE